MVRAYALSFLRAWLSPLFFLGVFFYLFYHGVHGELGFYAWRILRLQEQRVGQELRDLQKTRADLRRRVSLLKGDIDPDLLEEQVRTVLGYVGPKDRIFFVRPEDDLNGG